MEFARLIFAIAIGLAAVAAVAEDDSRSRAFLDRAGDLSRTVRHWDDRQQTLALEIVDRRGGRRERRLEMWTKRYADDASKTVLIFREPAQARGVGFLQWVDPRGPDSQWLFLPASKRVRQITGSRKKESFVGTDFSYEDLGLMMDVVNWTPADADSKFVREAELDGAPCVVIELDPSDSQDVSYSKLRLSMRAADHLVVRYEFFDANGELVKMLQLSDIRDVGGILAPHRMEMVAVKAGSRTVAKVEALKFNVGLGDEVFTKRRLERGG